MFSVAEKLSGRSGHDSCSYFDDLSTVYSVKMITEYESRPEDVGQILIKARNFVNHNICIDENKLHQQALVRCSLQTKGARPTK